MKQVRIVGFIQVL